MNKGEAVLSDMATYAIVPSAGVPPDPGWLHRQPVVVIAVGGDCGNADVIAPDEAAARQLAANIERAPNAALVLAQVLRTVGRLPPQEALTLESCAYGLLQAGAEHRAWLAARQDSPAPVSGGDGDAVLMRREGNTVYATLNRPGNGNALTMEMRDGLVALLQMLVLDRSIEALELSAAGRCFSTGGELREFGLSADPVQAHRIRSAHNPARLFADIAGRVHCRVHGACIGSGIELPAFAARVTAQRRTLFQLPELQMGLIPGAGGCVSISRRIGRQRTAWLVLSGRRINARTALDWGLIDAIVDD